MKNFSVFRFCIGVWLMMYILPMGLYIPNPGTAADKAQLRQLVSLMDDYETQCDDPELRELLSYTSDKYRYISRWNVRIVDFGDLDIAGMNWPHMPGMSLDRWCWENLEDDSLVGLMLHEALHDYWPCFGHDHMMHLVPVRNLNTGQNAWAKFLKEKDTR